MVSGGVDGLFDGAAAVEICGNKLLGEVSILKHDVSKLFSIFVFKDLVFHYMATLLDMYHDAVVGGDEVAVEIVLEGLYKDVVDVTLVGKHNILVSTPKSDSRVDHVVGIELAYGLDADADFIGWGVWEQAGDVSGNRSRGGNRLISYFEFFGANALVELFHVDFDG